MSEQNAVARTTAERVLVVDDSLVIRKAIEKHLKADFDVLLADNGEAAWEIISGDHGIKVLITDIEMPRLDGYGLICRIRAAEEPQVRGLPVIAITGAEDDETKARAFACGATDFIIKPIDPLQLHARVHAHVRFTDASRRLAEAEASLEDESVIDPLTRLCGRRYFRQRAEQEMAHAVRRGGDFLLVRLDVDRMKQIYAQHGDDAVDALLVWLAEKLKGVCRNEDTIARIGGAEFAILAMAAGKDRGEVVCNRIRAAVAAEPFRHGADAIVVTASIGFVSLDEDRMRSLDDILALAEQRLIHAKSDGGDRVSATTRGSGLAPPEEVALASPEAAPELPQEPPPDFPGESPSELAPESLPEFSLELAPRSPPQPWPELSPHREEVLSASDPAALPLAEIDDLLDSDSAGVSVSPAPPARDDDLTEMLSIDRALMMLAHGDVRKLEPWIDGLARRVLPMLEFCNRERGLGLDQVLADIRERLAARD